MSNCGNCGGVLKPGGGCGCIDCPPNSPGLPGNNGLTAYEIWIQEGNTGSTQDFLDSLVGAPGDDGNYVVQTSEPSGVNCLYGGTMIEVYDGVTAALINTTYVCNGAPGSVIPFPKENFYEENIENTLVDSSVYIFPSVGYETLTYTNNSGSAKKYLVQATWDMELNDSSINSAQFANWIDGALVKTISLIDSVEYECLGNVAINAFNMEGASNLDALTPFSPNKLFSDSEIGGVQGFINPSTAGTGYTNPGANEVATSTTGAGIGLTVNYTTDGFGEIVSPIFIANHGSGYSPGDVITILDGNNDATTSVWTVTTEIVPVEFRFLSFKLPLNKSIFKHVVLNDGESISLKFKSKGGDSIGWIRKAQVSLLEIDI